MRLILLFLMLPGFWSPPDATPPYELLGQWVRMGDSYEGMRIEVAWEGGYLTGRIVAMPADVKNGRFQPGDIKWQHIRQAANGGYAFSSLVISLDWQGNINERRYDDTYLEFVSPHEIHTQTVIFRPGKSGNFQRWLRVRPT